MFRKVLAIAVFILLSACVEVEGVVPPQTRMVSEFSPDKINRLTKISEEFSLKHSLELKLWKDKTSTISPDGRRVVYLQLQFKGDPVMVISSVVEAEKLRFSAADFGRMPFETLKKLVAEFQAQLESELNLEFEHRMEPWTTNLTSD